MTKQDLVKEMRSSVKGADFITCKQLCLFLGQKNNTRVKNEYLKDLDRVGSLYFIPDVAGRIMERRSI